MPPEATPPRDDGIVSLENVDNGVTMEEGEISVDCTVVEESKVEEETGLAVIARAESKDVVNEGKSDNKVEEKLAVSQVEIKPKLQGSWVQAVQNEGKMEKVDLAIEEIDGMPTARIPDRVFEEAQPLWDDFLVGKFLAKAPFVGGIHALVNKIWTLGDKTVMIDVFVVDRTTVRFRIKDERTRARVLRRGMWNLCGVPVVLSKWTPIVEAEQEEIKTIPLWVIVKNVPPKYFSWKVLSAITSPLGTPKKLHPETEACKSFEEAKVFVEVDLTKTLPKFFSFKSDKGGDTIVEFVYPWLPPRCTECSKWGHLNKDCTSQKRIEQIVDITKTVSTRSEKIGTDITELKPVESAVVVISPGTSQTQLKEGNSTSTEENKTEESQAEWTTPTKFTRSPEKSKELRYGEVSIMTNSFSCLSDKGEKGEDIDTKAGADSEQEATVVEPTKLITVSIYIEGRKEEFFVSFIYASNFVADRKALWGDLRHHHDSPLFQNKAWLICGDFNEILDGDDHSLYDTSPSIPPGMRDFQELVRHCELTDMSYQGQRYIWCNKRHDGVICKKLDRALVNRTWLQKYEDAYSVFEPGGCSDHQRCRIQIAERGSRIKKPFKFVNTVSMLSSYRTDLEEKWHNNTPLFHSTSAMHMLSKRLKNLKPMLREMGKKMKAKLHWMTTGDQNNKTFHAAAKIREVRNNIREIRCEDGQIANNQQSIKTEAEKYFKEFLSMKPAEYVEWSPEELQNIMSFKCDENDKIMLTSEVTEEEVKKVLFAMPTNKSPGPDGFTCEFFKDSWSIIGHDFVVAIQSFFKTGFLPKGVNSTILALIPKKTEAIIMKDYRPISCCNVLYKVISKILANRLKTLLPKFIAPNQSAFVKDRLLMENLLLATEIIKDYHKESVSPRCAMKIDISKAFDSVQWSFLLNTLRALDFPEQYVKWIKTCISTASFSVQVNGELAGYFGSERGLRQGCSLSPYLFVICMNVLSQKLDKAAKDQKVGYHPNCKHLNLTHLCFADDLMVFVDGTKKSIQGALEVFEDFAIHSGLRISLEKSTLYMAGIQNDVKAEILQQFPFEYGTLPVRYLGLPLLTRRMTSSDSLPLMEKIRSNISSWTARTLSFAGRLQLLKSVVFSITNFWIAAFRLPKACFQEIDKMCSAFLWSGPSLNSRKAKVSWSEVCTPKKEGGLGLRSLEEANKVSMLKLIWRILSAKGSSLWVDWVNRYLVRNGSFWAVKENSMCGSWIWRKLLKYRGLAKQFHRVEVKNGENTSFWHDIWSDLGCLKEKLGERGCIDLGIPLSSTMREVLVMPRRRKHRQSVLNLVEEEISKQRQNPRRDEADIALWKGKNSGYHKRFSTNETWMQTRTAKQTMEGYKEIWFPHATPKYAFITWLVVKNRVATGDMMLSWKQNAISSCVFCNEPIETRDHLFFNCPYSKRVWEQLVKGLILDKYSESWKEIINLLAGKVLDKTKRFLLNYTLQNTIHSIWSERNKRRHGEQPTPMEILVKMIDKNVRNRLSTIKGREEWSRSGIQVWFASRP
ncbi:Zinc finger CCHC-type [Arabidopsis thaliana x Arabidopsis arenosa]|uniref:Zinc finger CCHC-type n=1 Tax=Arabidopsis thaliana x Arabidopsis arenosa TaxID=1240361 RepID=A0A8T2C9V3_9BRAS|nr:Zinc finger CCHC-type [Arabidopsis thaliana x Arabidopsis arenosa]